jgi:hypothetical protein
MPIRPELRHHYRGVAWRETRKRILTRAKHCCERCEVPNHEMVERFVVMPGRCFTLSDGTERASVEPASASEHPRCRLRIGSPKSSSQSRT